MRDARSLPPSSFFSVYGSLTAPLEIYKRYKQRGVKNCLFSCASKKYGDSTDQNDLLRMMC